jgi:nucleoside-diphosphate-sugar epimerase
MYLSLLCIFVKIFSTQADAFVAVLGNPNARNQIYNISGQKYVTFSGLAKACAKAAGKPEPELVYYNPKVCTVYSS